MPNGEKKYQAIYDGLPETKFVQVDERNELAVSGKVSKRLQDGQEFENVQVAIGFKDQYGFRPANKWNATITLPTGLSKDTFQALWSAYEQVSNGVTLRGNVSEQPKDG